MPPVHDNGNVHCDLNARIQVYHPPMETRAALNGHSGTIHLTLIRSVSMAKIETPAKRVSPSVRDIYCYVASHLIPRDCITTRNKWKYTRDQFYTTSNYSIIINVLFLKRKINRTSRSSKTHFSSLLLLHSTFYLRCICSIKSDAVFYAFTRIHSSLAYFAIFYLIYIENGVRASIEINSSARKEAL